MTKIIGFSGLAGSGKDTAADTLIKNSYKFRKISFGDAVKDVASMSFGWSRELLQGDTVESRQFREAKDEFWSEALGKEFTPRLALQLIGTECFRNTIDNDFWVYVVKHRLSNSDYDGTYLITDVRFPNEVKMIHDLGGIVYRVKRGELPAWYIDAQKYNVAKSKGEEVDLPETLKNVHASERSLAGLCLEDFTLYNNGTLEEYQQLVLDVILKN